MSVETATVVDLGSSKIAALSVSKSGEGFKPVAYASVPSAGIHRGAIQDPAAAAHRLSEALDQLGKGGRQRPRSVVLAFGGTDASGELRRGLHPIVPPGRSITRGDVLWAVQHSRSVSPLSGRETVQTLPCYFRVDGRPRTHQPIGAAGHRLEVATFIVSADSDMARSLEMTAELADSSVALAVYGPIAAGFSVLDSRAAEEGVAVIDLGGGATSVGVFRDGAPAFTTVMPIGGQVVTSDVAKLLNTTIAEAERLKIEFGAALAAVVNPEESVDVVQVDQSAPRSFQRRVLAEIIESRFREMATAVGQVLANAGQWDGLPRGLVLTGGGSKLLGLDSLFEATTGIPTRTSAPEVTGQYGRSLSCPSMAVLVGAARFALSASEDDLEPIGGMIGWRERVRTMWSLDLASV